MTTYDYGFRIYNPAIARWLSVDPMRKLTPNITPYRFGFNNPLRYKDPNGKLEEDGHFWTVYAMGISMGLSNKKARDLAVAAEYFDHFVRDDNSLEFHPSEYKGHSPLTKLFVGTWGDPTFQGPGHGLTGGTQADLLEDTYHRILFKDINYLHTLGDAWAHSYVNEEGERMMFGAIKEHVPFVGYITMQHYFKDEYGNERTEADPTDVIHKRPEAYAGYLRSLISLFNDETFQTKYSVNPSISDPDLGIFNYVQKNGISKGGNVFLFKAFVEMKTENKTKFSGLTGGEAKLLKGYLDSQGIKYEEKKHTRYIERSKSTIPDGTTITITN